MIKTYLYAGVTLLVAVLVDYILRSFIRVPKRFGTKRTHTIASVIRNLITTVVYIVALYIILSLFGINLTPLLASATVIGIVFGIGARGIIEDFVNGLFLLSLDSIAIGDYLQIGTTFIQGDITEGIVERIGARALTIRTDNGTVHIIPNGQIRKIINFSRQKFNIIIDLPVKINQEIDVIIKAAENALEQLQKDPAYAELITPVSEVKGIENFKEAETMIIRVIITTSPVHRNEISSFNS